MRKARPYPLDESEARFDLGGWLVQRASVVSRKGPEWILRCPWCGKPKLTVHVARKAFRCWTCSLRGWSPILLVSVIADVGLEAAIGIVLTYASGRDTGFVAPLVPDSAPQRPKLLPIAPIPKGASWPVLGPQRAYAASRGISDENMALFGLASVLDDGSDTKGNALLRGRLLFPCWSAAGRLVFWQARDTSERSRVKVLGTPAACREAEHAPGCTCLHDAWGLSPVPYCAGKEDALVGAHLLQAGESAVLVEGPVDAAVCGPGFAASMSADLSPAQAVLIARSGVRDVTILYDPDPAGESGALDAAILLSRALSVRVARCPFGTDPAMLGRARALECAVAAPPPGGLAPLAPSPPTLPRPPLPPPFVGALGS